MRGWTAATAKAGGRWCATLCCCCCCAAGSVDSWPLGDSQPRRQQALAARLRLLLGGIRHWGGRRHVCILGVGILSLLDIASRSKLSLLLLSRLQSKATT